MFHLSTLLISSVSTLYTLLIASVSNLLITSVSTLLITSVSTLLITTVSTLLITSVSTLSHNLNEQISAVSPRLRASSSSSAPLCMPFTMPLAIVVQMNTSALES